MKMGSSGVDSQCGVVDWRCVLMETFLVVKVEEIGLSRFGRVVLERRG